MDKIADEKKQDPGRIWRGWGSHHGPWPRSVEEAGRSGRWAWARSTHAGDARSWLEAGCRPPARSRSRGGGGRTCAAAWRSLGSGGGELGDRDGAEAAGSERTWASGAHLRRWWRQLVLLVREKTRGMRDRGEASRRRTGGGDTATCGAPASRSPARRRRPGRRGRRDPGRRRLEELGWRHP